MAILASHGRLRHSHCIDQGTQEHQCPVCSPAPLVTSEGNEEDKDVGRSGGSYTDDVYTLPGAVHILGLPSPSNCPVPWGSRLIYPLNSLRAKSPLRCLNVTAHCSSALYAHCQVQVLFVRHAFQLWSQAYQAVRQTGLLSPQHD